MNNCTTKITNISEPPLGLGNQVLKTHLHLMARLIDRKQKKQCYSHNTAFDYFLYT